MSDEKKPFDFDLPGATPSPRKPKLRRHVPEVEEGEVESAKILAQARATGVVTTELAKPPAEDDDEWGKRTVPMPKRVSVALDRRSGDEGKTLKYYVLKGLQMQGFPVKDEDLEDRRGSALKEMAALRRAQKER
ncbi:hypothetical protein [Telmatospirillum sp. J64-1]|uniref:hypothetical protein n=1 Tax=Telmatospirillum sp. J64-1 TaxID=2502183 RepID=UPI00115E3F97|nr:hypothetical protein [Telmatospirillum sp. J64-1]